MNKMTDLDEEVSYSELKDLFNEIIIYLSKVRHHGEQSKVDSLEQVQQFETQIDSIRQSFDSELKQLRDNHEKSLNEVALLSIKLSELMTENAELLNSIHDSKTKSTEKDDLISVLKLQIDTLSSKEDTFNSIQTKYDSSCEKYKELKRQFEQTKIEKLNAENEVENLKARLKVLDSMHQRERRELFLRLSRSSDQVVELESRLAEDGNPSDENSKIIEKIKLIREAAKQDLMSYQEECEAKFKQEFEDVKLIMKSDCETITELKKEDERKSIELEGLKDQYNSALQKLESEMQLTASLKLSLAEQKENSEQQINSLSKQLRESHSIRLEKASTSFRPGVTLRTEIASIKALIGEEDGCSAREKALEELTGPNGLYTSKLATVSNPNATIEFDKKENHSCSSSKCKIRNSISAPESRNNAWGMGEDYFQELFSQTDKQASSFTRKNGFISSALGNLKICCVDRGGLYIQVINISFCKDLELGLYLIQQNVNGKHVASYRFPQRLRIKAKKTVTVWAACAQAKQCLPRDLVCKYQNRWAYGPDCTTILCKPNGLAIAWHTIDREYSASVKAYNDADTAEKQRKLKPFTASEVFGSRRSEDVTALRQLSSSDNDSAREILGMKDFEPIKHPHGFNPLRKSHPSTKEAAEKNEGNDQSSLVRIERSSTIPDIVPELYTGSFRTAKYTKKRSINGKRRSSGGVIKNAIASGAVNYAIAI